MGHETRAELEGSGAAGLAAIEDGVCLVTLSLDWFDQAGCAFWLAQGKKGIWLDLDGVFEQGHDGPWLERELAGMGVGIHAKSVTVVEDVLLALIVVDRRHERRVRKWLAKVGVLCNKGGGYGWTWWD